MALDMESVRAQVEKIARGRAIQYGPRCWRCRKTIPPQDYRTRDFDGHDICLTCGDGVKPDMEATK